MSDRYKIVCRNHEGEEIFTAKCYDTEYQAHSMAIILNACANTETRWVVEPLYYS